MSVYSRFKKYPGGFRSLVELLESTPSSRRQKMIDVGMAEDPDYTRKAMELMMTFQDVLDLPNLELAEVLAKAPPRMTAYALKPFDEETRLRFLKNCQPRVMAEVKDFLQVEIGMKEVGRAQLKLIETARQLERAGLVRTKKIPA